MGCPCGIVCSLRKPESIIRIPGLYSFVTLISTESRGGEIKLKLQGGHKKVQWTLKKPPKIQIIHLLEEKTPGVGV